MEFSDFYKTIPEGIVAIDKNGSVIYSNYAANLMFGFDKDAVIGKKLLDYIADSKDNDTFIDAITDAIYSKDNKVAREVTYKSKQYKITYYISSIHVETNEFNGIIMVFSDISDIAGLKEKENALQNIKDKNAQLTKQNEILTYAFSEHLDDTIVEELLNSPEGVGIHSSIKKMTLFMLLSPKLQALVDEMKAPEYLKMLNHYYDKVIPIIKENNGTIFELHSDSILVGFGAPKVTDTYTDDAFKAACLIQKTMNDINTWNKEKSYPEIKVRIGIHTGEFPIGIIGGSNISKYNVFGREINFTARITITSKDGDVVMSDQAIKDLKAKHEVLNKYQIVPKGITTPVDVYKVI